MRPKSLAITLSLLAASGSICTSMLFGDPPGPAVECKTGLDAVATCFGSGPNGKCNSGCSSSASGPGTSGIDWVNKSVHVHNSTGKSVNGGTALMHCRRQRNCKTIRTEMAECSIATDSCVDIIKPTPQEKYDPPICTEYKTTYEEWIDATTAVVNPCPPQPVPVPVPVPEPEQNTDPLPVPPKQDPLEV